MNRNIAYIFNIEFPIYHKVKKKKYSNILIRCFNPYQHKIFKKIFYEFYFRKNYLESHPTNGETGNKSSLVIEIFFEKNTNLISDFNLKYIVNNTIAFKRFIDFQYLSNQNFLCLEDEILQFNNIYEIDFKINYKKKTKIIPIDIIPTFFSKYNEKKVKQKNLILNYGNFFHKYNKKNWNENLNFPLIKLDKRSSIGIKNRNYDLIDFLYDDKPNLPCNILKKKLFEIPLFVIGYLCLFLKRRPIWTRRALECFIPFSIKKFIKKILPICSYRFKKNNPYKRTWIRYGYDPRIRTKSLIYQTFNVKELNQKYSDNNIINDNNFKIKFKTNRFYKQMCELEMTLIRQLIKSKKNFYINSLTGWLTFLDYIILKKKIKKKKKI